jgi:thiol-disulfide isomerase/thioredoxin
MVLLFVRLATLHPAVQTGLPEEPQIPQDQPPQPAPDIHFAKFKEGPTSLSALRGKVVVLDFWATWCGPCRMSIPRLNELFKAHRKEGLLVIGISVDDPSTQAYVPVVKKELKMEYPVTLETDIPDIANKYEHDGIPAVYLIDRNGNIRFHQDGYSSEIDDTILKLLKEKA